MPFTDEPSHEGRHHLSWDRFFISYKQYYRLIIWSLIFWFLATFWLLATADRIGKVEKELHGPLQSAMDRQADRVLKLEQDVDALKKKITP